MKFEKNIAFFDYKANAGYGIEFPARTTLINAENLCIISPGNFSSKEIEEIRKISDSPVFVAPNNYHHLYLGKMKKAFPTATFYGTKRAQAQSGIELLPIKELMVKGITPVQVKGNPVLSEYCFYHEESKSLITTDIIFNLHSKMSISTRFFLTLAGTYHKTGMSRLVKMGIKDKDAFYTSLRDMLKYPFENLVVAHGPNLKRKDFEDIC
jgi:hypothetical protein